MLTWDALKKELPIEIILFFGGWILIGILILTVLYYSLKCIIKIISNHNR